MIMYILLSSVAETLTNATGPQERMRQWRLCFPRAALDICMFHLIAVLKPRGLAGGQWSRNRLLLVTQFIEPVKPSSFSFIIRGITVSRSQGWVVAAVREPAD